MEQQMRNNGWLNWNRNTNLIRKCKSNNAVTSKAYAILCQWRGAFWPKYCVEHFLSNWYALTQWSEYLLKNQSTNFSAVIINAVFISNLISSISNATWAHRAMLYVWDLRQEWGWASDTVRVSTHSRTITA